jgi:signal transduction histidine kinase/ActR/RegA family two-component response regulator
MGLARRRVPYLALAGLAVAIVAAVAALFLSRAQSRAGDWSEHSLRVQILITDLTDHIRAIESEHRGYVLTGSTGMKANLTKLADEIEPELARLAYETSDNPMQTANIARLRRAVAAKLDFARQGVIATDSGEQRQEAARIESGEGVRRMNAALAVMQQMVDEEEGLLAERRRQTDLLVQALGLMLVGAVLMTLIVAAIVVNDSVRRETEILHARDGALAAEAALREQMMARESAEEQLRQMQKMESIGQLTGGIAHDFNNMLAIVIGSLDLARRRLNDPERLLRYIDNAHEGAERAAALTARLLAFSRQQPLAPVTVDVNKLVASMSELLQRTVGEQYLVETVLAGGLWRTFVDPGQLENAVINLAVNARDAMPEGGHITIETANAYLDDDYARSRGDVAPGQYVMLSVTDAGIGMTADVISKAFEPFFTTKPVGKGTGLGLSQIFGFMKQTGGHAAIYSEPGHGTTVKLYIPRHQGQSVDTPARSLIGETEVPLARPGETILVVEDEQRVRHFSVDALRELGYVVISAGNGGDALKALRDQPSITMLFTDIVMPEMNGRKLADAAMEMRPDVQVLFTTGYTRNAVVHNGMLDAGVAFLPKPFSVSQLGIKVREVLDGKGANRPI